MRALNGKIRRKIITSRSIVKICANFLHACANTFTPSLIPIVNGFSDVDLILISNC
jgi:hypothetical protein